MATLIASTAEYDQVRSALDVNLTSKDLPDGIIQQLIYADAAESDVLEVDADALTRTGAELVRVKRAAIFFCAARLAPVVVRITSRTVQTLDASYQKQTFDPTKRAAELRDLANKELAELLTPEEETQNRPTMFARAPGYRGR